MPCAATLFMSHTGAPHTVADVGWRQRRDCCKRCAPARSCPRHDSLRKRMERRHHRRRHPQPCRRHHHRSCVTTFTIVALTAASRRSSVLPVRLAVCQFTTPCWFALRAVTPGPTLPLLISTPDARRVALVHKAALGAWPCPAFAYAGRSGLVYLFFPYTLSYPRYCACCARTRCWGLPGAVGFLVTQRILRQGPSGAATMHSSPRPPYSKSTRCPRYGVRVASPPVVDAVGSAWCSCGDAVAHESQPQHNTASLSPQRPWPPVS